ncbi:YXWGXW repeat-containing protein [Paraburkholderia unamae]|uniref:YXWGXW repeat-containing protein n=1 Tax=Paraburkholderia unamae TaxID=219649 RepID=A0ABX5KBT9_9BURK|nr:YXWGXW repeat-containing protein [Paraburkholderia unamae]PVX73239.1 YXWGXW repeat-containing protein [Paraburkholderia unamae]
MKTRQLYPVTLLAGATLLGGCIVEPARPARPPEPPPRVEAVPPAPPQQGYTWVKGHYRWERNEWVWEPGHWVAGY